MIPYISAFLAYLLWGLSPIFWKLLSQFQTFELASFRVIISFICFIPFIQKKRISGIIHKIKQNPVITLISCCLMFTNIYLFVYAVNSGQILEASFGYFLSPLVSMALAYFVLKEKLSPIKLIAVCLAIVSILIKLSTFENFPWVSLILGGCFSVYGLLRKYSKLNAIELTVSELSVISVPAFFILTWITMRGESYFGSASLNELSLLSLVWIPTLIPFLLFSHAAKYIELNILSFIQYLAPSIQFILGVYIYQEKITSSQWLSFILVWIACLLVIITKLLRGQNERK